MIALLCGFAVVDSNTRQTGYGDFVPLLQAQQADPLHYEVSLFGEGYVISMDWLNTALKYAQEISPYTPAKGRLAIKLAALGAQAIQENLMVYQ